MCQLCDLERVPSERLEDNNMKRLGYIGTKRRRLIHEGKGHTLPEETIVREWRQVEALKQKGEKQLRAALGGVFGSQRDLLLKRLAEKVNVEELREVKNDFEITPYVVEFLIDWEEWFNKTGDVAEPNIVAIIDDGFETALNRVGASGPNISAEEDSVNRVLQSIVGKTKRTQDTFRNLAVETIQRGLSQGDNGRELVERVARKTNEQIGFRLDRIVRTAGNGGFEFGEKEAMKRAGIERVRWLTQRDPRVRTPLEGDMWDHRSADGQKININSSFLITGRNGISEHLRFPSDPQGSPGNVIYCRCSLLPATEFEQPQYPPSGV